MSDTAYGQFTPDWALHPGVYLRRMLEERGIRQAELAERTGLTAKHINQIVNQSIGISADVALLLDRALGTAPGFWTRAEADYQARASREKAQQELPELIRWARRFDKVTLRRYGIVAAGDDKGTQVEKILRFSASPAPRRSTARGSSPAYHSAAARTSLSTSRTPPCGCALWTGAPSTWPSRPSGPRRSAKLPALSPR